MLNENVDLSWVDDFILSIKPFIFLREYDSLLILLPNSSYKLNSTAYKILYLLINGKKINELIEEMNYIKNLKSDLYKFFISLKTVVKGNFNDHNLDDYFEVVTYCKPWHKLPILSEVAVTYKCNLKCKFCYACLFRDSKSNNKTYFKDDQLHVISKLNSTNFENNYAYSYRELTTQEIKTILYKIKYEAQVPSVSFTGGEPCIREDLIELIEYASSIGLRTNLISNGTMLNNRNYVKNLKKAGLASAQISLEATTPKLHDYITGLDGAFELTTQAIYKLQEEEIPVHTNTTVSKLNLIDIYNFPAFIKKLGLDRFSMNLVIPAKWMFNLKENIIIYYSEIGKHINKLQNLARQYDIKFMWYSPTPYCIFNPVVHNLGNKGCAACDGLLSVAPNGQVIPCSCFFLPQGSLLYKSFEEIWNNSTAKSIRNKDYAPSYCKNCDKFIICEGACPLYWQTLGTSELKT